MFPETDWKAEPRHSPPSRHLEPRRSSPQFHTRRFVRTPETKTHSALLLGRPASSLRSYECMPSVWLWQRQPLRLKSSVIWIVLHQINFNNKITRTVNPDVCWSPSGFFHEVCSTDSRPAGSVSSCWLRQQLHISRVVKKKTVTVVRTLNQLWFKGLNVN